MRVGTAASLVGRRVMACKAAEILKCCGFQALRGYYSRASPASREPREDEMAARTAAARSLILSPPSRLATVAYHQIHVTAACAEEDTAAMTPPPPI